MTVQAQHALAKAQHYRLTQQRTKRAICEGRLTVAAVLRDPAPEMANVPFMALLMAQHQWGRARALPVLRCYRIGELRTLGELTERQRFELADHLETP